MMLAGCAGGADEPAGAVGETTDGITTLRVGASPVPHAEILEFVDAELAAGAGLDLEVVTFDDYVLPNRALLEGDLDANYFQHLPYLESQVQQQGWDLGHFEGVHIEPYGLYSSSVTSVEGLPEGATIGVTNDPGNQARALRLLEDAGLIRLAGTTGDPTLFDVEDAGRGVRLVETAPEQLVRSLEDLDAAVINGNYALEAGLNPAADAIHLEDGEGNPFANLVAFRAQDDGDPSLAALDALLRSDEVRAFIEERWPAGEVLPAF
ncbi:MAG: MetQ/NlpA family ABC transporter substrate-binding protein [Actinotalea sp.]|nr:MetQ/NlpA family ABC transporter substrate-binding protein [Actinotalea sp.]